VAPGLKPLGLPCAPKRPTAAEMIWKHMWSTCVGPPNFQKSGFVRVFRGGQGGNLESDLPAKQRENLTSGSNSRLRVARSSCRAKPPRTLPHHLDARRTTTPLIAQPVARLSAQALLHVRWLMSGVSFFPRLVRILTERIAPLIMEI